MVIKVERWMAEDGTLFDTQEAAERYENFKTLTAIPEDDDASWEPTGDYDSSYESSY